MSSSQNPLLPPPIPIEEVAEDTSLSQNPTPLKERTISYSDSEGGPEHGKSFDRVIEPKTPEAPQSDFSKQQDKSKLL